MRALFLDKFIKFFKSTYSLQMRSTSRLIVDARIISIDCEKAPNIAMYCIYKVLIDLIEVRYCEILQRIANFEGEIRIMSPLL